MSVKIRVKQRGLTVSWGMFASINAVHAYAKEHGFTQYEILQGGKSVFVSEGK